MSQKAARFSQELLVEGNHDAGDPHHDVIRGAEDHGRHLAMVLSGEAVSQLCRRKRVVSVRCKIRAVGDRAEN
jgi:hypothetical protein